MNTQNEHLVDGEHLTFCKDAVFKDEDEKFDTQMMHPSLVDGADVWMAGEIQIYLTADLSLDVHVNDASGHYMEQTSSLATRHEYEQMIEWLFEKFKEIVPQGVTLFVHACGNYRMRIVQMSPFSRTVLKTSHAWESIHLIQRKEGTPARSHSRRLLHITARDSFQDRAPHGSAERQHMS